RPGRPMNAQPTGRPSLPPGVGASLASPSSAAQVRATQASPLHALVAGPYLFVLSPLLALVSFARFLGSPESAQHFLGLGARGTGGCWSGANSFVLQLDLEALDERVREQLGAHTLDLGSSLLGSVRGALHVQHAPDAHPAAVEAELAQRPLRRLALRIEDALLRPDDDGGPHVPGRLLLPPGVGARYISPSGSQGGIYAAPT